jgi:hypothetical protein
MTRIADLLDRDFSRPIEEIIKVNNDDQDTVYTELWHGSSVGVPSMLRVG